MTFPLGRPILLLLLTAVATAGWMAASRDKRRADLVMWTFSSGHAAVAREAFTEFSTKSGWSVAVQALSDRAENLRLQSLFLDPPADRSAVPDLVEIEVGQVGRFFRPPVAAIGLLPLNDFLARDGLANAFDSARLATWSKQGVVFGLPLDLHPVALAYRADLFAAAGVDLRHARTWEAFQAACLNYQSYWQAKGQSHRRALELSQSSADNLSVMLQQRGIELIDAQGRVAIDSERTVQTLLFYAQLAAGPKRIGLDPGPAAAQGRDARSGAVAVFWMPDWRLQEFKAQHPELAGQMRLIPLPRFESTDAPTASWGGTMLGIPRSAGRPEQSWAAAKHLLFDPQSIRLRGRDGVLPAVAAQRADIKTGPDAYFNDEDVGRFYSELVRQMPSPAVTPQTVIARAELSVALSAVITQLQRDPTVSAEPVCRRWLSWAAADLSARLAHERRVS